MTDDRITRALLKQEIEDFLYREAALLDAWQLDDWLELLTDDAQYRVPSNDRPRSISVSTTLVVELSTPEKPRISTAGNPIGNMEKIGTPSITVASKRKINLRRSASSRKSA